MFSVITIRLKLRDHRLLIVITNGKHDDRSVRNISAIMECSIRTRKEQPLVHRCPLLRQMYIWTNKRSSEKHLILQPSDRCM